MTSKNKITIFSLILFILCITIFFLLFSQDIFTHIYKNEIIKILDKHQNFEDYKIVAETSWGGKGGVFWENLTIVVENRSIKNYKIQYEREGWVDSISIDEECDINSKKDECFYSNTNKRSDLDISKYLITRTSQQLKNEMNQVATIFNINNHPQPDKIGLLLHKFRDKQIYSISKNNNCYEVYATTISELCISDKKLTMDGVFFIYSAPTRSKINYLY